MYKIKKEILVEFYWFSFEFWNIYIFCIIIWICSWYLIGIILRILEGYYDVVKVYMI